MTDPTPASRSTPEPPEQPRDAFESLLVQDRILDGLLAKWSADTRALREGDDVNTRWERGSAVKLIIQHLAVREEAVGVITGRLREVGRSDLADALEGDGEGRRRDIQQLEGAARGHQAITLNSPEVDIAVERVLARTRRELDATHGGPLAAVQDALGSTPEERQLPSDRFVRMHSVTRPSPVPKWYDRIGPLRAARAFYDHLRGEPSGMTSPGVDMGREHEPGPGH